MKRSALLVGWRRGVRGVGGGGGWIARSRLLTDGFLMIHRRIAAAAALRDTRPNLPDSHRLTRLPPQSPSVSSTGLLGIRRATDGTDGHKHTRTYKKKPSAKWRRLEEVARNSHTIHHWGRR